MHKYQRSTTLIKRHIIKKFAGTLKTPFLILVSAPWELSIFFYNNSVAQLHSPTEMILAVCVQHSNTPLKTAHESAGHSAGV